MNEQTNALIMNSTNARPYEYDPQSPRYVDGYIDCPCWVTGHFVQVPCPWHDFHCWNCGRIQHRVTMCECGIDLWAYPHRVPVEMDEIFGTWHVTSAVRSQFLYAMRGGKANLP